MTNHLGHMHGVFDKTGNRVESHSYSTYGYASGDDFSLQPFGMSTKRSDFASGLVYFGYRFYVPHLGRWLNRAPLQEQGGIDLYAYVQGDPLGCVDPDGRFAAVLIYAVPTVIAIAAFYDGLERCKALGRCDFSGLWHSNEAAESKGDSSDVPVNCPTEDDNSGNIDDLIKNSKPGRETKGCSKLFGRSGGFDQANDDFNMLNPSGVRNIPCGRVGKLNDGRTVIVRGKSSDGRPTLEIQQDKNKIKFRYDK